MSLHGDVGSADQVAATAYPAHLQKSLQEKGCLPEQVFNMDESRLWNNALQNLPDEGRSQNF